MLRYRLARGVIGSGAASPGEILRTMPHRHSIETVR